MPTLLKDFFSCRNRNQMPTRPNQHHPNYNKLKDFIARCKIAGFDCVPSCREVERLTNIGKSSVSRHLFELSEEGWVRRTPFGNTPRNTTYSIAISIDEAVKFRSLLPSAIKKKKTGAWDISGTKM